MLHSIPGHRVRSARAIARTSSGVLCRRSARRWTVIPGAPAATHTSTASRTLGAVPPREFRSVATLLTLMLSRTIEQFGILNSELGITRAYDAAERILNSEFRIPNFFSRVPA